MRRCCWLAWPCWDVLYRSSLNVEAGLLEQKVRGVGKKIHEKETQKEEKRARYFCTCVRIVFCKHMARGCFILGDLALASRIQ